MKLLRQDRSEFNVLFVHSELDDYGLDAQEFRIYAHLARRANGKTKAYPGITSMAESCRMNRHTVLRVVNSLEELGLIKITKTFGRRNEYVLTPPSEWKRPNQTGAVSGTGASQSTGAPFDTGAVPEVILPPVSKEALKGNPKKGNPFKDNTAGGQFSGSENGGRPPVGGPAMFEQASLNSTNGRSSQSQIQRKAYALAELLQFQHWDNCKIFFVKQTARAYAEGGLRDGHDATIILKGYEAALKYCHGVVTDEICRCERHSQEKASPALTVWLARQRLAGDPRTIEQRWEQITTRLTAERRKAIEEEQRIRQEAAAKASEINAWFASETTRNESTETQPQSSELEPVATNV
jgi:DNA-binding MarR family transcriptional regulator